MAPRQAALIPLTDPPPRSSRLPLPGASSLRRMATLHLLAESVCSSVANRPKPLGAVQCSAVATSAAHEAAGLEIARAPSLRCSGHHSLACLAEQICSGTTSLSQRQER